MSTRSKLWNIMFCNCTIISVNFADSLHHQSFMYEIPLVKSNKGGKKDLNRRKNYRKYMNYFACYRFISIKTVNTLKLKKFSKKWKIMTREITIKTKCCRLAIINFHDEMIIHLQWKYSFINLRFINMCAWMHMNFSLSPYIKTFKKS